MSSPKGQLRTALQSVLLDGMIRKVGSEADRWKVLVVDRSALRILAAALQLNKLVDEGITLVEMLDMRREPLPRVPAIYFVTPTAESVEQLAKESSTQYRKFHLFFTGRLPDFLMDALKQNTALLRKVETFVELNVQLLSLESRVFSLDRPGYSLPQLYAEDTTDSYQEMKLISERLTETCKTLAPRVDWTVRNDATSTTSRTVASLVKEQLETARLEIRLKDHEEAKAANEKQGTADEKDATEQDTTEQDDKPVRATLLVLDRATDMASPLVHEFSYQSMAHDLLNLNYRKPGGAHIEIPDPNDSSKKKAMQLEDEDEDPIWSQIRSKFVEEALIEAQKSFKNFLETDAAFKIRGKDASEVDIKDMGAAVRALPDSQMRADKHAMHINALKKCLDICHEQKLNKLALVEQELVIGRNADGTKIPTEEMVRRIVTTLNDDSIPIQHRVRLLMLAFVIIEGLLGLGGEISALASSSVFRHKLQRSGFQSVPDMTPELSSAIKGLKTVLSAAKGGFEAFQSKLKPPKEGEDNVATKLRQKYAQRHEQKTLQKLNAARRRRHGLEEEGSLQYDVARYHPPLRSVMMDLVDDELDREAFPLTGSISANSIIASSEDTSSSEISHTAEKGNKSIGHMRYGSTSTRSHSSAMVDIFRSVVRIDSDEKSRNPNEDDGKFRLAEKGHLYIVFVVGGVCYSEVRSMYEVCAKREADILIGGSQVITPRTFTRALSAVADPVERIRVMLPPLPLELAQSRAARARTIAAGAAQKLAKETTPSTESSPRELTSGTDDAGRSFADERSQAEVQVVTGYSRKNRLRLFGRKK